MADSSSSAAQAIYPNLPSESEAAPPVRSGAGSASERTAAEAIYGSTPGDGLAKAREGIAAGVARPAGEPPTEQAQPSDWLAAALKDQGREPDAPEPVEAAGPSHLVEQFHELARDAGLSSASSEKMLKLHQDALADASTRYWDEQGTNWAKQSRAQFGSRLDSMVNTVKPLLNDPRLTPPAFRNLLAQYRIGSYLVVIDTLNRWANAIRRR